MADPQELRKAIAGSPMALPSFDCLITLCHSWRSFIRVPLSLELAVLHQLFDLLFVELTNGFAAETAVVIFIFD